MNTVRGALARPILIVTAAMIALAMMPSAAQAGYAQGTLVKTTPVSYTPNMKTGYIVHEDAVVGDTVYVGGQFTQFEDSTRTITYDRQNFVAYSASTGAVSPLTLNFNKDVAAMVASPDGKSLYIGGYFSTVNGVAHGSLVRLDLATGTIDPAFKAPPAWVYTLAFANDKLYVGGIFAKRLMAVSPTTGADTGTLSITVAGVLETSGGVTRIAKIAINPAGTDLVAIGDFTTVNGQPRRTAFRLSLGASSATLSDWHPQRFDVSCFGSIPYFLRDVDWAPDGSYFGIVSTGGPAGGYPATGFCDAAGRWEASSSGNVAEPTWINWTGGDSLYAVAISGTGFYVAGHNRWLDNPQGHDSAGAGAYKVNSIGVITPSTGLADRTWNVGNTTRAHGKEDLTLFAGGLVVGGDGTLIKNQYHRATAILPL